MVWYGTCNKCRRSPHPGTRPGWPHPPANPGEWKRTGTRLPVGRSGQIRLGAILLVASNMHAYYWKKLFSKADGLIAPTFMFTSATPPSSPYSHETNLIPWWPWSCTACNAARSPWDSCRTDRVETGRASARKRSAPSRCCCRRPPQSRGTANVTQVEVASWTNLDVATAAGIVGWAGLRDSLVRFTFTKDGLPGFFPSYK